MPMIGGGQDLCTVIVTVDAEPEVMPYLEQHARLGLDRFGGCAGYIGGALHVSDDSTRLVQYVQWESKERYVACRDDPRWDELGSTRRFLDHVRSGRARVDARIFDVVASSDQSSAGDGRG